MLIVTSCRENAVKRAKSLSKTAQVKIYETATRKYLVTDQPHEYREIDFRDKDPIEDEE